MASNKVVLLTGASLGIGRAIALQLASNGYQKLALLALEEEPLDQVALECRNLGASEVLTLVKDLSDPQQCKEAVDETVCRMGGLHMLIGNAGTGIWSNTRGTTLEQFKKIMDVNLFANFVLTKRALPHLEETKGNIVYMSSTAGEPGGGSRDLSAYSTSKAALTKFAQCVALEEAARGVRVNVVAPGLIATEKMITSMGKDPTSEME